MGLALHRFIVYTPASPGGEGRQVPSALRGCGRGEMQGTPAQGPYRTGFVEAHLFSPQSEGYHAVYPP